MDAQSQNSVHANAMAIRKTIQKNRIFFTNKPIAFRNRRNLGLDAPGLVPRVMKRLDHWAIGGPYSIAIRAAGHLVCISGLRTRHQNRANQPLPNNDWALAFVRSFCDQLADR